MSCDSAFQDEMDDDLNTAGALGVIFEYIREINQKFEGCGNSSSAREALGALDDVLGVLGIEIREEEIPQHIRELAAKARRRHVPARDYAAADALRSEISAQGYELKDTPDGVKINKR